jgi:urease beta subunit
VKPGELLPGRENLALNVGRPTVEIEVENSSQHVVFISSHFPFFEVNRRLVFDRTQAWGMHLDLPAGDAECWQPGETKRVQLVAYAGRGVIRGFNGLTNGLASPERLTEGLERVRLRGFGHRHAD